MRRRRHDYVPWDRSVALGLSQFLLSALNALWAGGVALSSFLGRSEGSPWPATGVTVAFAALAVGCWRKRPSPSLYGAAAAVLASTNLLHAVAGDPFPNFWLQLAWVVLAWTALREVMVRVQRRNRPGDRIPSK